MAELTPQEKQALEMLRNAKAEDLDALSPEARLKFKALIDKARSSGQPTGQPTKQAPPSPEAAVWGPQGAPEEAAYAAGAGKVGAFGKAVVQPIAENVVIPALQGAGTPFTATAAGVGRLIQSGGDVGAAAKAFTESALETTGLVPILKTRGVTVPDGESAIEIVTKKAASGQDVTGADKTGYYFEFLAPIVPLGSVASGARAAVAAGARGATIRGSLAAAGEAPATTGFLNTKLTEPILTRGKVAEFVSPLGRTAAQLEARQAQRLEQAQDLAVSRITRRLSEKAQKEYAAQRQDLQILEDIESDFFNKAAAKEGMGLPESMQNIMPGAIAGPARQEAEALRQQAVRVRELKQQRQAVMEALQRLRQENPELVTFSNQTLDDIKQNVAQPVSGKAKGDIFKTAVERKREQVAAQVAQPANPFFRQASPEDVAFSIEQIAKNPGQVYTRNLFRTDEATQPSVPPVIPPSNGESALTSYRQGPTLWNRTASGIKKWGLFVESNLKKTPSGTQLYREIEDYNAKLAFAKATTEQLGRRWQQLIKTPEDTQAAVHLAHGLEVPKGFTYSVENVNEAVRLWRNADDALLRAGQNVGLDIQQIPNHFRLKYRPDLQDALANRDPVVMKAIIKNLVRDGLDEASASKLIGFKIASAKEQKELFEAMQSAGFQVKTQEDAVRMLANSDPAQRWALIQIARGKVQGTVGEIVQELTENGLSYRNRTNHSLETRRKLNIPELADMNDFIHNATDTLDRGWERVLQVKKFGLVDEAGNVDPLAQRLVDAYARESAQQGFTEGADLGRRYLDLSLRRNPETEYLRVLRTGAAVLQLPGAFLGQAAGLVTNATMVRPAAFMEGAFRTLKSKLGSGIRRAGIETTLGAADREFVLSTAVMSDSMMPGLFTEASSNVANALSGRNYLEIAEQGLEKVRQKTNYLLHVADRIGKEVAINSGAAWGKQVFRRLQAEGLGGRNQWAATMLSDAGVNVERALQRGALSEADLASVGRMVANRTASQGSIKDLPLMFQHEIGKTIFQYRGSVTNAARTYKQVLLDQFKTGRLDDTAISAITAVVGAQAVGEAISQTRALLFGDKRQRSMGEHVVDNFAAVGLMATHDKQIKNLALEIMGKPTRPDDKLGVPALSAISNIKETIARTPSGLLGNKEARDRFLRAMQRTSPIARIAIRMAGVVPEE